MHAMPRILLGGSVAAALAAGILVVAVRAQEKPEAASPAPAEDPGALVRRLGDADFATREKAYEGLRGSGAAARKALEEGAESEDAQVRWSSRRLLRLLDEPGASPRRRVLVFGEDGEDREAPQRGRTRFEVDEEALRRSMDEMRRRMEEMEKEMERDFKDFSVRLPTRLDLGVGAGASDGKVERSVVVEKDGERTEVHEGADGSVKVVLTRKASDGTEKAETFEAPSRKALAKEHPEVHAKVKDLLGDRVQVRVGDIRVPRTPEFRFWPTGPVERDAWTSGALRSGAETPVLGVMVSDVPAVLRTQLSLKAEEGVVVEEVLPGTPASRMGLQRHDVVLGVNGIPVSSAEDLRASVGAVPEGGALQLRILRGGKASEVEGKR